MKSVKNRIPTLPNRKKITYEDGRVEYVTIEYADEPLDKGTPIDEGLFKSIEGDIYRIDKYTKPTYKYGEQDSNEIKTGTYIGLWGSSHYTKAGITVSASNEDGTNYAYNAMNGVNGYWSGNTVPTVATPTLFTVQLAEPIALKKFTISGGNLDLYCKDFKLQGSNDGDTYYDIMSISNNSSSLNEYSTDNIEYYKYYRLSITSAKDDTSYPAILEFNITAWQEKLKYNKIALDGIPLTSYVDKQRLLLDIEDTCDVAFEKNILPPMIRTNENGYLIQSSGDYINTSVIDAFDYDTENSYWRSLETQQERYIMVTMPINVVPSRFLVKMANVKNGKIQGSTNGDDWDDLKINIITNSTDVETQEFDVTTEAKYRYFRFVFNANIADTSSYIYSFEIPYGYISGFNYSLRTFIDINSLGDREVTSDSIVEEGNYEFVYNAETMRYTAYLNSFSRASVENTFTAAEKEKLAGIEVGAEVNIIDGFKLNGKEILPDSNRVVSFDNVEMITNKVDELNGTSTNYPSCKAVEEGLKNAGQYLIMDNSPIKDSKNPITSGGVYTLATQIYEIIGNVETLLSQI